MTLNLISIVDCRTKKEPLKTYNLDLRNFLRYLQPKKRRCFWTHFRALRRTYGQLRMAYTHCQRLYSTVDLLSHLSQLWPPAKNTSLIAKHWQLDSINKHHSNDSWWY